MSIERIAQLKRDIAYSQKVLTISELVSDAGYKRFRNFLKKYNSYQIVANNGISCPIINFIQSETNYTVGDDFTINQNWIRVKKYPSQPFGEIVELADWAICINKNTMCSDPVYSKNYILNILRDYHIIPNSHN